MSLRSLVYASGTLFVLPALLLPAVALAQQEAGEGREKAHVTVVCIEGGAELGNANRAYRQHFGGDGVKRTTQQTGSGFQQPPVEPIVFASVGELTRSVLGDPRKFDQALFEATACVRTCQYETRKLARFVGYALAALETVRDQAEEMIAFDFFEKLLLDAETATHFCDLTEEANSYADDRACEAKPIIRQALEEALSRESISSPDIDLDAIIAWSFEKAYGPGCDFSCESATTCSECFGTGDACVWCEKDGEASCAAASEKSSCDDVVEAPSQCVSCAQYGSCGDCAKAGNCTWCPSGDGEPSCKAINPTVDAAYIAATCADEVAYTSSMCGA